jgi:hypothetical protein
MAQEASRRPAADTPKSAARFLRRSAQAIRARSAGIGQRRAEYLALVEWAQVNERLLRFDFIEQFSFIGDGAEHRVYKSVADKRAIKATHPNKFGYSTLNEGCWATPIEYLMRLAWQNFIFGDDIRLIGVAYEEDQMEVVHSQPWIDVHNIRPNPFKEEIDEYMGRFGFVTSSLDLDTPLYYSPAHGLLAGDAHDRNILRDNSGNLSAIDLVIGRPGPSILDRIEEFLTGPTLPF